MTAHWRIGLAAAFLATFSQASADPALSPDLSRLGFLVGHWRSDDGKVADTGGTSAGVSVISAEAGGAVLLRRDHTDLFDKNGKPAGGFEQIMMIYPEKGTLRADYSDGQHVIHYSSAEVAPGKSVTFTSAPGGGPTFRLSYDLKAADTLAVTFAMAPPGQAAFNVVAAGTLKKTD